MVHQYILRPSVYTSWPYRKSDHRGLGPGLLRLHVHTRETSNDRPVSRGIGFPTVKSCLRLRDFSHSSRSEPPRPQVRLPVLILRSVFRRVRVPSPTDHRYDSSPTTGPRGMSDRWTPETSSDLELWIVHRLGTTLSTLLYCPPPPLPILPLPRSSRPPTSGRVLLHLNFLSLPWTRVTECGH